MGKHEKNTSLQNEQKVFFDKNLLKKVLLPYKEHCRYLQSAEFEPYHDNSSKVRGRFSIPESCYIANTGHFNAVEFNICYNQLGYYLLGECVQYGLLKEFLDWDIEEYYHRQLSDVLIVEFASRFHKMIRSERFKGQIEIKNIIKKTHYIFIKTTCEFNDEQDGFSSGKALLAIYKGEVP